MLKLRRLLPSPNALYAFEAAARRESFSEAARELHVTQPAISRRIQDLETRLGVQLFRRKHRAVELTAAGRRFYQDITSALDLVYGSAAALEPSPPRDAVVIGASSTFACYWLLPVINQFEDSHPDIEVYIRVTDRDSDLDREGIDLSVFKGYGDWGYLNCWRLADEVVVPICSPRYLESAGPIRSVEELPRHRLLHAFLPYRVVIGWKEWLTHHGVQDVELDYTLTFNDPVVGVQAALHGIGVSLGWEHIVQDMLDDGRLVRPVEEKYVSDLGMYLIESKTAPLKRGAQLLKDWMLEIAPSRTPQR